MRRLVLLLVFACVCLRLASAQTDAAPAAPPTEPATAAPPLLSPQAAYDQASAPVDITHRSMANWSEIEKAALTVAVAQAKDACLARSSATYAGDDLIAYARLCDLGQQWPIVLTAASSYIGSDDTAKPQLDHAYAFEVAADLNMKRQKAATTACFAMLRAIPYGPLTDDVTTTTIRYLQFAYLADALDLSYQRQPYLLRLIHSSQSAMPTISAGTQSASAQTVPLHTLVRHALDFAALQQYDNQAEGAAAIVADIDRAMPANPPSDEAILIAADRRQYALLGTRFPDLPGSVSLLSPTSSLHVNFGAANIFLLFPPWCAQCLRQEHEMTAALMRHSNADVRMFGLLADDAPPPPPPPPKAATHGAATSAHHAIPQQTGHAADSADDAGAPKSAQEQLRGTLTLVVATSTLAEFNAADFPFLIATDHSGIIRLMVPAAPENALVADGPVDQILQTVLEGWPPPKPTSAPASPPR